MKRAIITACITVAIAIPALAGPLNEAVIAADAKWVGHVDMTRLRDTKIWQLLQAEEKSEELLANIEQVQAVLGCNPMQALAGVTVYGASPAKGDGVMIANGNISVQHLKALLASNPTHTETAYGSYVISAWTDKKSNKPSAACFIDEQSFVAAGSVEQVKAALDAIDKNAEVDGSDIPTADEGTVFFFHTEKLSGALANNPHAQITKSAQSLTFSASEAGENVAMDLKLAAASEEKALQIQQVVSGMLAFMALAGEENPEAAKLAQDIKISADGATVSLGLTRSSSEVFDFLKKEMKAKEEVKDDDPWKSHEADLMD